jgi:Pvc16 N-terminal domain/IPT/TIG domain
MSKSQAIAAVTAVLAHIVGKSANADVDIGRPKTTDGQNNGTPKVNVYLYQVTPNAAWGNEDLATRDSDGKVRKRPQIALDLHYLFSFYGDEAKFEPQLMMGAVMRDLHAGPLLTPVIIAKVGQDAGNELFKKVIADSELNKSVNSVKLTLAALSLDELSKIWSIFFQTPYALSVAYQATVVLIEKEVTPEEALPVRDRGVHGVPLVRPEIGRIIGKTEMANPDGIIKSGATVLIQGKNLQADETTVLIDGLKVALLSVSDQEIALKLPAKLVAEDGTDVPLRAGSHALQVVHGILLGGLASPEPHQVIESSPIPFLMYPTIQVKGVADKKKNGLFSAKITLSFDPAVAKSQRVWILLKETPAPADRAPRAYRFMAPKDNGIAANAQETIDITFPVKEVASGDYLLQAHVDGAESPPVEFKESV